MFRRIFLVSFILFCYSSFLIAAGVVSTEEANRLLNSSEKVIFVDARGSLKAYGGAHIPGAVSINNADLTTTVSGVPGIHKNESGLVSEFRKNGIDRISKIIVYSDGLKATDYTYAARVISLLNYIGIDNTFLIDGGFKKWQGEGKPYESGVEFASPSNLSAVGINDKILVDLKFVQSNLNNEGTVFIDARSATFYNGEDSDKRLTRHGHIPGAINIYAALLVNNVSNYYLFKSVSELGNILNTFGIGMSMVSTHAANYTFVSYCNTGVLASADWFVAKYVLNIPDVRVYDGSMVEYTRSNLPIASAAPESLTPIYDYVGGC